MYAAILFLTAFTACFIQRVTGFGFGIVFVSVAPFLLNSHGEATALSGMLAIVCALVTGIQMFRYLDWKKMAVILPVFLLTSFFSVRLVARMDAGLMRKVLGVALILVSLYFLFMNGKVRLRPTFATQASMGTLSGLMGGLFGMQGPPAVIYFISCTDDKNAYMALCQWYFIIGNCFMTIYRAGNGFLTHDVQRLFLICTPAVILGLIAGSAVYRKIPVGTLRTIVYVFIALAGLAACTC